MGAQQFMTTVAGQSAKDAFRSAVEQAQWNWGHAGYTGTIAEKQSFVMIDVPEGKAPIDHAHDLLTEADPRIDDKWGPAGCIRLPDDNYLFFGWAST